ncbi:hypothetical protein [Haloplanus rubicundus]|uniref:hypothetical protein n=1 Tax=Haloplanus rubicundus TaxID=1547898 RepID=UPI0013008294|nr:hypothetical protein [Haloplanus rubicundus]
MDSPDYPHSVSEYLDSQGWNTTTREIREGTYVIAGSQDGADDSSRMLTLVVDEPESELTTSHLKYLFKTAKKNSVSDMRIASAVEITDTAKGAASEHDIKILNQTFIETQSPQGSSESLIQSSEEEGHGADTKHWTRSANWVYGGRAVGGELELYETRLVFNPRIVETSDSFFNMIGFINNIVKIFPEEVHNNGSADQLTIRKGNVSQVLKEPPRQRGIRDTLYAGGLRTRLRVELQTGEEHLFIVTDVDNVTGDLKNAFSLSTSPEKIEPKNDTERDTSSEAPTHDETRYPIASVFAGMLLIWAGFFSISGSGSPIGDFLLFTTFGATVLPRIRKSITNRAPDPIKWLLSLRTVGIGLIGIYSLFVLAAIFLIIGEAVNDPQMSAATAISTLLIMLAISVGIVKL